MWCGAMPASRLTLACNDWKTTAVLGLDPILACEQHCLAANPATVLLLLAPNFARIAHKQYRGQAGTQRHAKYQRQAGNRILVRHSD